VLLQYLVAGCVRETNTVRDFKASPVTVATLASAKGTLINPLHFDFVPFNVFPKKEEMSGNIKAPSER
jgi:hypothetical protein